MLTFRNSLVTSKNLPDTNYESHAWTNKRKKGNQIQISAKQMSFFLTNGCSIEGKMCAFYCMPAQRNVDKPSLLIYHISSQNQMHLSNNKHKNLNDTTFHVFIFIF